MTLESCKKCKYHLNLVSGQVMCKYRENIDSLATENGSVIGCPIDKTKY